MHISEIWEDEGFGPALARWLLFPFSLLYGFGWELYLSVYEFGLKKAKHPHSPIVCVGNLVSGGSGKTPVTLHMVQVLRDLGHEVAVSCSGYGSPKSEAATVAPEGDLDPAVWGDEAALFRNAYPDLPLIVGRRRVLAAQLCHEKFPNAVMLMDDGFQHLPLKKDITILLEPLLHNRFCLPAGPYREPRWNRKRADLVIPGKFHISEEIGITTTDGKPAQAPKQCSVLCAIGQPQKVMAILELMSNVTCKRLLPDHDPMTGGTLISDLPDQPVVVTAKDWVKLRNRADVGTREFFILSHQAGIEPKAGFSDWLQSHLDALQKTNHSR